MNKGGKYIFGKSLIGKDLKLRVPPEAVQEYDIASEGRVYVFTGSKSTGGFCVTRRGLLKPSKLGHIIADNPDLSGYKLLEGEFIRYKGRSYCWLSISQDGIMTLNVKTADFLGVKPGMELLCIRSSDIAFTLGAKGPLLRKAEEYPGEIEVY